MDPKLSQREFQTSTLHPLQQKSQRFHSFGLLLVVCLLWTASGCFRSSSIEGLPCVSDMDCSHLWCVQGVCSSNPESPIQEEPSTSREPLSEPTPDSGIVEPSREIEQVSPEQPPQEGQRQLHQACLWWDSASPDRRCAPGFLCVRRNAFQAFCLQDCSEDVSVCSQNKDGRTDCVQVAWTREKPRLPKMVCLQKVAKDQACDLGKSITCQNSGFNHLLCNKGRCAEARLAKQVNAACGLQWDPPIACDITRGLTCSWKHKNTCQTGIVALEGDNCTSDSLCEPGFVCLRLLNNTADAKVCAKMCNTKEPSNQACPGHPNFTCIPTIEVDGVCQQTGCTTYHDCGFQNPLHECRKVADDYGSACVPFPNGSRKLGQSCDPSFKNPSMFCKAPFSCIRVRDTVTWTACLPQCRFESDCKAFSSTLTCDTKLNVCAWRCLISDTCPKGMQCSQQGVCARPPGQ